MGGMARVQDRQEAYRPRRPRISEAYLPQVHVELHLVGKPQGCRGLEYLPGRISRAEQHRRVRPQRSPACRRLSRAVRRNQLDGHVHPESARYRTGTGKEEPCYEDVASKFWEHFIYIAHAMSHRGHNCIGLWNEEDGFFYDVLKLPDGSQFPMKIRSMVGLIPLFAVETLEPEVLDRLPDFKRRLEWFIDNRPDLTENSLACAARGWESVGCCRSQTKISFAAFSSTCWTSVSFYLRTGSARCLSFIRKTLIHSRSTEPSTEWTMSRANRRPDYSEAIRTG